MNKLYMISWGATIVLLVVVTMMGMNDVFIKIAWNELSRNCNTEPMITKVHTYITGLMIHMINWYSEC